MYVPCWATDSFFPERRFVAGFFRRLLLALGYRSFGPECGLAIFRPPPAAKGIGLGESKVWANFSYYVIMFPPRTVENCVGRPFNQSRHQVGYGSKK